ncbi:SRPBCC family protein [Fluviicola sp.]|uniref:SRPBCC family protein n=1 Tax=Fluviicola sp. TaxID=1917219 RepID=UPI00261948BA|nr:SRPBCC family protein [Fluviicola sp.]
MEKVQVTVQSKVNAPVEKVWEYWNAPEHIVKWNSASPDWHTPRSENDLRAGGKFSARMEAKDGSFGFDFGGVYDEVVANERIAYTMEDGRKTQITFINHGDATEVIETFDAEGENPIEMQQAGWQAILDNFKKYTETY